MKEKKQTEFTFKEAKEVSINHLSILAEFMEGLHDAVPNIPIEWALNLRMLGFKIQRAQSPCLTENDIIQVSDLANQLIYANPDTTLQLTHFWNIYQELYGILLISKQKKGYALQWKLEELRANVQKADLNAERLISERAGSSPFVFLTALLLAHLIRVESIEYPIWVQLQDIVQQNNLQKYDVALMCSVKYKVTKYNKKLKQKEWRSDVRAIRDAIAHSHYSVVKAKGEDIINFDNVEEGYDFHEQFTVKEFHHLFDVHTVLYKFQIILLYIIELLPVLTTHLVEKPIAS